MPLPIPFYLRTSQNTALTHAQLDGNLSILSTKIDNTTCGNIGTGIGIFQTKEIGNNDGLMNLRSLSGTGGILIGITGDSIVIDGSGTGGGSNFWAEFGTFNKALKDVKGTYNTSGTSTNTLIAGGSGHTSHNTLTSFFGGGQVNRIISGNTSAIVGGKYNTIKEGDGNVIIGGSGNTMGDISSWNVVTGLGNECSGSTSVVFGGLQKNGISGNTVIGHGNFVEGSGNNIQANFNFVSGTFIDSKANNISSFGSNHRINNTGVQYTDFVQSFVTGLNHIVGSDVQTTTLFGQAHQIGTIVGEEGKESPVKTLIAGLSNMVTGATSASSILSGQDNRIGYGSGTVVNNSAILAAKNSCLGAGGRVRQSSILAGQSMSAYTDDTAYVQKLQPTEKVRVSSYDYILSNSITTTDSPTIHNVVHDTNHIDAIPINDGGGEIVRYGLCASEEVVYTAGQFVNLEGNGCWKRTDVSTSGRTDGRMVGFALSNSPTVAGAGKGILIRGHLKLPSLPEGALPGEPLYLDASVTGAVTKTPPASSGNIVRAVGHLVGGPSLDPEQGYMFLNPDITYLQVT